ncbi:TPA: hypothetical protein ACH9LB_005055 [Escherichia coli]
MLPSETMIWQPEFTDKTLSRKPGAVQPVEITPDEQKEPVAAIAPSLSTSTQTRVSASSCKVEFRHGNMTLENPSPELLTVLIRELTGRGR